MSHRATASRTLAAWLGLLAICAVAAPVAAQTVTIVKSKRMTAYEVPARALAAALAPMTVRQLALEGTSKDTRLLDQVAASGPDLIVALGARALSRVATRFDKTPILYAMVLNPSRVIPAGRKNVAGIALEVPFEAVMTQLLMASPSIKRVGVIYHPGTSLPRIQAARKQAGALMLQLIEIPVKDGGEVRDRFDANRHRIDALWMVPDAVAYTRSSYRTLIKQTWKHRIPFCAFSRAFVASGALLSIAPSYASVGEQLALLTRRILKDGLRPGAVGRVPPIGTNLVINQAVAKKIGLVIDPDVLDSADEVIE